MDAKELNRILNRGLVHKATIDPSTFENLVPKFKEYAADKEIQEKVHGNKSNEYIDITYQSFGYGLDDLTIKLFIRYLVLKGEIFGFSQTRDPNAFRIELNDPGTRKRNVNGFNSQIIRAEELISLDNFMKQHELPLLTDYDSTQQKI
ncbi:MAG: hypothetical protein HWD61_00730 [Parachlamydiaceae bacterium]|nr:MAG: hypothetical protein HWD61_00730 [Parachlamydiaceae bacterium]